MYRLCEARMNGAIGNDFYEEQMIDLVATLNFIVPLELCANASLGSVPGERPEGKTDQEGPTVSGGKPMDPEAVKPTENAAVNAAVSEIDVAPGSPLGAAAAAASDLSTSIATGREPALLALSVEYMKTCATLAQEFGLKVSQNASERMLFRREAARAERISLAQYREYLENSGTQKASPAQN